MSRGNAFLLLSACRRGLSCFLIFPLYFQDVQCTARSSFIVDNSDDEDMVDDAVEDESDDDVFDSVCAFCDNGGDLLWYAFPIILCCE